MNPDPNKINPASPTGSADPNALPRSPVTIAEEALHRADRAFDGIARSLGGTPPGGAPTAASGTGVAPGVPAGIGSHGNGATVERTALRMLDDVDLDVRIELGRTRMLVEDVLRLGADSVVELDKAAGDPVDIFVNGRLIARGEVLVVNENFCIRVSEILEPLDRGNGAAKAS